MGKVKLAVKWRRVIIFSSLLSVMVTTFATECKSAPLLRQEEIFSLSTISPSQSSVYEYDTDPIVVQYERLLRFALEQNLFHYTDNHRGRIAWNTANFLDSLLNMWIRTQDVHYLDVFVAYADATLMVRDDIAERVDFTGRSRPGWQANSYYTLGYPYVLLDAGGHPVLRVQAIRISGNDHTTVRVKSEKGQSFTLEVSNDFRRPTPVTVYYKNLTMDTVETVVNSNLSPRHLIRVQSLGDNPPAEGIYALRKTYVVVLHGEHTPAINIPLARFVALVREQELEEYQSIAERYLRRIQESYRDYSDLWREDEEGGYFVFDSEAPIWSAGLPVPYNGLALHGRFLIWLFRATGEPEYWQKAEALIRKIRGGMVVAPDGTLHMSYWYGRPFDGWSTFQDGPSSGLYEYSAPFNASEDTSHFTLTIQFLLDAYDLGLLQEDDWAYAAARTYVEVLLEPECHSEDGTKFLAHNLEGQECLAGYPAGVYTRLAPFDSRILDISLDIYKEAYTDPSTIDPDYMYGYVMLGWSLLAMQSELEQTHK